MRKWNVQIDPKSVAATTKKESWSCIVDGILFVSFISYDDLMEQVKDYLQNK